MRVTKIIYLIQLESIDNCGVKYYNNLYAINFYLLKISRLEIQNG